MDHQRDDQAGALVAVPEHVLVELQRLAVKGLTLEARVNGVVPGPAVARLFATLDQVRRVATAPPAAEDDLVSAADAAAVLGITKRAALLRIAAGTLPARRVAGRWLVRRDALPEQEAA